LPEKKKKKIFDDVYAVMPWTYAQLDVRRVGQVRGRRREERKSVKWIK